MLIKKREKRFSENRNTIKNQFKLRKNNVEKKPRMLRDIYMHFDKRIHTEDIVKLLKGKQISEHLINVYFKILEKINFVLT